MYNSTNLYLYLPPLDTNKNQKNKIKISETQEEYFNYKF